MNRKAFLLAALVLAAMPAPAYAAGSYYVRNDSGRTVACSLRRPHSEIQDQFQLRAGADWSQATESDGNRTLICFVGAMLPRYRLRSGVRYALVDQRGRIAVRVIGP